MDQFFCELFTVSLSKLHAPVAESHGVKIHCPPEGRFSFFNSPYPSHKAKTGVDVYPGLGFGEDAPSPVEGRVIKVRRLKAPPGRGFKDAGYEIVTLIDPGVPGILVKLLHVDTTLKEGDQVEVGDTLGGLLRSGYYGWGTSSHIHVEVRKTGDAIRARGGYELNNLVKLSSVKPTAVIRGTVEVSKPEYTLMRLDGGKVGLIGEVNSEPCVLDGGIPYYGWMGVHTPKPTLGTIMLAGKPVGDVENLHADACTAKSRSFTVKAQGTEILGLSLYLTPVGDPLIKMVPRRIGGLSVGEGDSVEVEIG